MFQDSNMTKDQIHLLIAYTGMQSPIHANSITSQFGPYTYAHARIGVSEFVFIRLGDGCMCRAKVPYKR